MIRDQAASRRAPRASRPVSRSRTRTRSPVDGSAHSHRESRSATHDHLPRFRTRLDWNGGSTLRPETLDESLQPADIGFIPRPSFAVMPQSFQALPPGQLVNPKPYLQQALDAGVGAGVVGEPGFRGVVVVGERGQLQRRGPGGQGLQRGARRSSNGRPRRSTPLAASTSNTTYEAG